MNVDLVVKSLQVLEQGVNLATKNGAFANAKDVSSLVSALEVLANYVKVTEDEKETVKDCEKEDCPSKETKKASTKSRGA